MMQQVSKRGWTKGIALFVALLMSFGIMSARAKVALAASVIDGVEITGVDAPKVGRTAEGYTKATVKAYYGASSDLPKNIDVKWYDEKNTDVEFTGEFEENTKYIAVVEIPAERFSSDAKFSKNPDVTWNGEATTGIPVGETELRVLKEYHTAPFTITFIDTATAKTETQTVREGLPVEFPDNTTQFFLGWVPQNGTNHYKKGDGQVYIPTNDVTFYADYGETRTITFHANYPTTGVDEVKSVKVQYGSSYTLSRIFSESSLLGTYIIGWSTENDDTPEYAYNGTISSVTEDMNLWAVWSYYSGGTGYYPIYEGDITLVFHSNHSNSTGSMSNQIVAYSSANTTRINKNQFRINNTNNNNSTNSNNNNNNNFIGWTVETPNYSGNSNGNYNYNYSYNSRLISDEAYVSTALNAYFDYYNGNSRYNNSRYYNGRYYNSNNRYYNNYYGNRYPTGWVAFSEDEEGLTAQDEGAVVSEEEDPEIIAQLEFTDFISGIPTYTGSLVDYYNNWWNGYYGGYYGYEYDYIIDLYAQWNDNNNSNITVTFNSNGGVGTMSDQTMTSNISTALKTNTFTRPGYEFVSWNTNANGTGTDYTNGQSVSLSSNITLYAQWRAVTETPVTSTPTVTPTTTPTTPTATTGAVATAPIPTYATAATTPAVLAATADPTSFIGVVTAAVAGFGATFAGIRSKKHSKR